ncbi:ABC-three component system protein [Rhizobium rhizoryzae]|uniref:ABC-three component systems C-terminal domain-containing protein n=1 Tax=Rhizobium rhizoryzae TaxID=451876 RepID=A0A7W6LMN5_9HYPH|nr:ABC-three component system protein [Rhizobium rhizoryzae]MBB4145901.1 hypothetical protein [Rhizobium rhizoryzae]
MKIDPNGARFRYYVSEGKPGSLMTEMDKATTNAEATKVLKKIRKQFDDCDKEVAWQPHLGRFLAAGDVVCCAIVERCSFQSEADPLRSIRDRMNFMPPAAIDELCAGAIGLARNWMDDLIRQEQSRAILAVDFRRKFSAFVRRHNFSNALNPAIEPPDDRAIDAAIRGEPLFVRQLKAVEAPQDMLVIAVSDYMRTTADKVKWADDGTIYGDSFVELDDQLVRKHSLVSLEIDDTNPQLDVPARGRSIYWACSKVTLPLEGQSLPGYFISGAFNCLAQGRRIGWHRDYETLFPPE